MITHSTEQHQSIQWQFVMVGILGVIAIAAICVLYIAVFDPFSGVPSWLRREVTSRWIAQRWQDQDCQMSPWTDEVVCQKVVTYQAYDQQSQGCTQPLSILMKYSPQARQRPLLVFTTGTFYAHDETSAQRILDYAVQAGATAVSVDYANLLTTNCYQLKQKAQCIYDSSLSTSAVSVACDQKEVDCQKGIVVSGVSQGSMLALLSKNYSPLIKGLYAVSTGEYPFQALSKGGLVGNFHQCLTYEAHQFRPEEMLLVNGEADQVFGSRQGSGVSLAQQLDSISGRRCSQQEGWSDCRAEDGSGWYIVKNEEVQDGAADHCFPYDGGCSSQLLPQKFDSIWLYGNQPWSLSQGISFLQKKLNTTNKP